MLKPPSPSFAGLPIPASSGMDDGAPPPLPRRSSPGQRPRSGVIVRMQFHTPTINYVERRTLKAAQTGEFIRCLKRFLAREIFQRVMADYRARQAADLGGLNDRLDIWGVCAVVDDDLA